MAKEGLRNSGQGTIEYLLLTALVVGVVLTIFRGPLQKFLSSYTSRKQEYTQVVSQRRLGIPLAWFGGNFPDPAGGPGSGTDPNPEDPTTPPAPTTNDPAAGDGSDSGRDPGSDGGDTAGGNTAGGPGGAGAGRGAGSGAGNNSLFGSPEASNSNRGGRGGRDSRGKDDAEEGGFDTGGGGGPGGRGSNQNRAEGGVSQGGEAKSDEEKEKDQKGSRGEFGAEIANNRQLYGSENQRVRSASCENLDLKTILQIVFVIGLFFLLASILFQNRGSGKD